MSGNQFDPRLARAAIGGLDPAGRARLRATLEALDPHAREVWWDRLLGIEELPTDGPDLPKGCVPYLPCPLEVALEALAHARVGPDDVLVDVGSGLGRVTALAHAVTGAEAIGVEVQLALVRAAQQLASALQMPDVTTLHGDALEIVPSLGKAAVFFLYCPFGGTRLERFLDVLEPLAQTRPLRLACVQLPPLSRPWLTVAAHPRAELTIYETKVVAR